MMIRAVLAASLLLLASCDAPRVTRTADGVRLASRINPASAAAVDALLRPGDTLTLDSDGGYVAAAAQIAVAVMQRHVDTRVDGECASACVLVFAAGKRRSVASGSRIGVHQSTDPSVDSLMAMSLSANGAPPGVVDAMLATPPALVTWLNAAEIAAWTDEK